MATTTTFSNSSYIVHNVCLLNVRLLWLISGSLFSFASHFTLIFYDFFSRFVSISLHLYRLFLCVCSHFIWFYGHFIVIFMFLYLFNCSRYIVLVLVLHLFFMFLLPFLLASLFKVILCNFVVIFDFVMSSINLTLWSFSVFYFHLLFSLCLWGIMFVFFVSFCFFCNCFGHFFYLFCILLD